MAQLKDLLVAGPSRFIGDMFGTNLQITKINAPTVAGGAAYGVGSAGQALCSNGTSVYWGYPTAGSQANLVTTANSVAYFTNTTGTFAAKPSANGALYATSANGALQWGTLPVAQGGTGHASNLTAARLIYSKSTTEMADSSIVVTGTGTALTITGKSGAGGEYIAQRGSSSMWLGYGTGNVNHGVYSNTKGDWIVYSDGSGNVTLNGNAATAIKLANGRTLKVNLASTSVSTAFDGSANVHNIGVDGVLPLANGGTGKTNAQDAANVLLNGLSTGSSTPVDADYYISQCVGGGTTTTTYHRRPMSALWAYIDGKITANRITTATQYGVAYYSSTTKITSTAAGTAGYPLIGAGSAAPTWYGGQINTGTAAASWKTTFNGTTASTTTATGAVVVSGGVGVGGRITASEISATRPMVLSAGKVYSNISGSNVLLPAKTSMLFSDGIAFASPGLTVANDVGWIRMLGTSEADGVLEIATGDDGGTANGEAIVARQYNTSNVITHEATLLAKQTGATNFPVSVTTPIVKATGTTNSTSSTTGTLIVSGGVGIANDIFSSGKIFNMTGARIQYAALFPQTAGAFAAGWRRCCKVRGNAYYGNFLIELTGGWSTGAPTMATVAVVLRNKGANMKILHVGYTGNIQKIRLVHDDSDNNTYWLDVYIGAWSANTTLSAQVATFIGNVIISDINTAFTDAPSDTTATAELDLTAGASVNVYNGTSPYVAYYSGNNAISSAQSATNMIMPSHYYHTMYSNATTGTEVYVHYYNNSVTATTTNANFRVKNGSSCNVFRICGAGEVTWDGTQIRATAGYLASTKNGNTVTIGSQNGSWCHFTNSANIDFYFNHAIHAVTGFTIYNSNNNWRDGYLTVSKKDGTDAYIELDRGTNANWRLLNHGGNLYLQSDWTTAKTTYYNVAIADYNTGNITIVKGNVWIQGGSNAGGNVNRMSLSAGMPTGLQYNSNQRGVRIWSNAIAFADPYNGNTNNDAGWIRQIEETGNQGSFEIAVGDDGNEPIYVRQYNTSSNIKAQLTLLDANSRSIMRDIYPASDNTYTLGTTSLRWKNAYIGTADTYGYAANPIFWNNGVPQEITYLNTHAENDGIIFPFLHNDIAFVNKRGGSYHWYVTTATDYTPVNLAVSTELGTNTGLDGCFDGSGQYNGVGQSQTAIMVIDITCQKTFTYINKFYIDFGCVGWRAKKIYVYVRHSTYDSNFILKNSTTTNGYGNWWFNFSHQPTGQSSTGVGFNQIRVVLTDWNSASDHRVAQIGLINYSSLFARNTYMSRGVDDQIFRSITPNRDVTYSLGDTSHQWNNVFSHVLTLGGATTATMTNSTTNPRIVFQEATGTQPVILAYSDFDNYRAPAGLKVMGGANAIPAWFEVEGNLYVSTSNTSGNGIYLADDGSLVDNNDGYLSLRFTYGLQVKNGKNAATTVGRITNTGKLELWPTAGNYQEGIRIHPCSNWSTIMLLGNDTTAESATSANSWGIFNNNGSFWIGRNGSSSATYQLGHNGTNWIVKGHFAPQATNTYTLGTTSLQWSNVYATTFTGALSGNATTATTLQTARTIWGQSFNGSANVTGNMTDVGNQIKLVSGQTGFLFLTSDNGAATGSFGKLGLNSGYANIDFTNYTLDVNGATYIRSTTDSTSVTTGAIRIDGGIGVAKNIWSNGFIKSGGFTSDTTVTSSVFKPAITLYPSNSNEINFGGYYTTNRNIYFGYRKTNDREIPTTYCFGPYGQVILTVGEVAAGTTKETFITLGNNKATSEANNGRGRVRMYGTNAYCSDIIPVDQTANRSYYLTKSPVANAYLLSYHVSNGDLNAIYGAGIFTGTGSATNGLSGDGKYYAIISVPYNDAGGNTHPYWGWQIGTTTGDNDCLFFRLSNSSAWRAWRQVVHIAKNTSLGSSTKPVYVGNEGAIVECSTYAGGTAVTLNNASKAASTASFYAPTAGGANNTQALVGAGTTTAPKWVDISPSCAWTAGTTAGPSLKVTVLGQTQGTGAVIPSAGASASGIVTTDTQTFAGAKTFNNNVTIGTTTAGALGIAQTNGLGLGISLYGGPKAAGAIEYGLFFGKTATFGTLGDVTSDWATYFTMNRNDNRGWIFKSNGGAANADNNVASISGRGHFTGTLTPSNWINGQKTMVAAYNIADYSNTSSYNPWVRATNTWSNGAESAKKGTIFSFGTLGTKFYWVGSDSTRTTNGYDNGLQFDVLNGQMIIESINPKNYGSLHITSRTSVAANTTTVDGNTPWAGIRMTCYSTTTTRNSAYGDIRVYNNNTDDGSAVSYNSTMLIQGCGDLYLGGGEAPHNVLVAKGITNGESTYIVSDGSIWLEANAGTAANRCGIVISTAGHVYPQKAEANNSGVQDLGQANSRWATIYGNNIWAGNHTNNTSESVEYQCGARGGAGTAYLFSQPNYSSGGFGIYAMNAANQEAGYLWWTQERSMTLRVINNLTFNIGGMILNGNTYGTSLPTSNLVAGRLFFLVQN